jgi:hypothetical protein
MPPVIAEPANVIKVDPSVHEVAGVTVFVIAPPTLIVAASLVTPQFPFVTDKTAL